MSLPLINEFLGLLPAEVLVGEMAILGRLEVNGFGKIQLLDNDTRSHVKVLLDDVHELFG